MHTRRGAGQEAESRRRRDERPYRICSEGSGEGGAEGGRLGPQDQPMERGKLPKGWMLAMLDKEQAGKKELPVLQEEKPNI